MKTIHQFKDQELQWFHPNKFKGEYELRGGDEVFARCHLPGTFASQIVVETANGNWILQRKGIGQSISIADLDSQAELATIKCSMSGQSTLLTLEGREYRWRCTSFWRDVWTWLNNEDTPLLHLMRGSRIQLEPPALEIPDPDLALLATMGWYLHKQQEEAATVAAIVPIIG